MRARAAVLSLSYGFLLGSLWSAQTLQKASAVCTCKNLTICEQFCNATEEIHDFICFGWRIQQDMVDYKCVWNLKPYRTYNLYTKQRLCKQRELENQSLISKSFTLLKINMTAYAIAASEDQKRCTIAKFTGIPLQMIHCDPPNENNVRFKRRQGYLSVTAEWRDKSVKQYYVKYREQNSTLWKEVQCNNSKDCIVGNLTSYMSYEMHIQCVVTTECPQCPLSEVIHIPQEFVDAPTIKEINETPFNPGQRIVIVKWQYKHSEAVENYNVTIWKASGELAEVSSYILKTQTMSLILCYSAYMISINAFNRAGSSPPAYEVIKAKMNQSALDETFNVSVKSNSNFRLSWNKMLSQEYACYSVEWWRSGEKISYESFFVKKAYHDVRTKNVTFQPYKRYHFFLHARPDKDTCNLKNINDSEKTYGTASVYLLEGTPLTAPGNVSVSNVTQSSFVLNWSPVAEEDLRGFPQGYIIYYGDALGNIKNITVGPHTNSYKLINLRSRNEHHVQLSAFTAAGEGKRSALTYVKTNPDAVAIGGMLAGVVVGIIALLLSVHFCCRLLHRSKNLLWPSIPNPCNSNAVQKIEGGPELELFEPLYRQNLEETEEHVSVVEFKKYACCSSKLTVISQDCTKANLTPGTVAEDTRTQQSPKLLTTTNSVSAEAILTDSNKNDSAPVPPIDTSDSSEDSTVNTTVDASNTRAVDCVSTTVAKPAVVFVSDYTTMELFQQISKAGVQDPSSQIGDSDTAPSNSGQDYIRQALSFEENL
ncbi:leukemia inhibitory factor receptor isoform X1 [Pygocentrus nattereri]|uniref:leukemia inhibitory factor receptor isoform X1 n=1 Tax=Pygocentrus nattereri TaxID=42514 RepID=UPI000814A25C|nr:leukemia inhibitory factor receptor isoform X1 [Pygocentrus nattereri]